MFRGAGAVLGLLVALGSGCKLTERIGETTCTRTAPCDGDAGGGSVLPIGDAALADFDPGAFRHVIENLDGVWYGLAAGFESFGPPFEMRFMHTGESGEGSFAVRCLEQAGCVPFGRFDSPSTSTGLYRLIYVDSEQVGQGEFRWDSFGVSQSMKFRNLRLQSEAEVLSFYIELSVGSVQVVLTREPWPFKDAGASEDAYGSDAGMVDAGALPPETEP
jgi:hypothetical protein